MKQQKVCVVELQPDNSEYKTVASKFNETCADFIIEKVSLPLTWSFYTVEIEVSSSWINTFSFTSYHIFYPELEYIMAISF